MFLRTIVFSLFAFLQSSFVVAQQGSISSWGYDAAGLVSSSPLGTDYVEVASGINFSLALKDDGSLVSWGQDLEGQITNTPTGVGFAQVACGGSHSLVLKDDGSLFSWGRDLEGQVSNTPAGFNFVQIAAGDRHSLALKLDGSIVSWGGDTHGVVSSTPAGTGFSQVDCGYFFSMALTTSGDIISWGADGAGQVSGTPTGGGFSQIAAGYSHGLALKTDGSLISWGSDSGGQVINTPTGNAFRQVDAGNIYSMALLADGSISSWGNNLYGTISNTPQGNDFVQVRCGESVSFALKSHGPPPGYNWTLNPTNGHFYALTDPMTWAEAIAEADILGASVELITINDAGENSWILSTLIGSPAWIGFTDEVLEGSWVWRSGEPATYTNWAPGMPDNHGPLGQDVALINHPGFPGLWDDAYSDWIGPAILEYGDVDPDDDGLTSSDEFYVFGTDPDLFDTDRDGLGDGQELGVAYATAPFETDPAIFVEDSDPATTTDPLVYDTDGGGASDGNEDVNKNGAVDANEGDPNISLDDLFQLSVLGLSPGQQATISVWGCHPGSMVVPAFSTRGQGPLVFPQYNQLEVSLSMPLTQLTGMQVNQAGTAFSVVWVPPFAPIGRTVYWQAVEISGVGEAYRPSVPLTTVIL